MRKNSKIRALASALLTAAMITTMGGMTAFAETPTEPVTAVPVVKTVTTDGNTYAPNTSFTFEVKTAGATTFDGKTVYAGIPDGVSGTTVNSAPATPSEWSDSYTINDGSLSIDASKFSVPGIYHYQVSEARGNYDGMDYSTDVYDMYVYVYNNDTNGVYVGYVCCTKDEGKTKSTDVAFENNYGAGENDSTHDMIIKKNVTGNQGDTTKPFTFKVTVNGAEGEWYKVVLPDGSVDHLVSGTEYSYPLKHNETLHVYGLSGKDTYTVTEVEANTDGYTTTGQVEWATSLTEDETDVTITNHREVSTPTGIALTFAPYILMVALAGVFAVLFLRKKREEF